ncbi:hypothetical protein [uncultured Methanobrevibacter sp.]|uniref:hypothetical protein n=1 Tax=uncultured Methanobrevibacter sp. TaxID=253161 RepID=UPI00263700B0|nr:hypothetical protein [uncultured Methanobrevibacter sp.]
MSASERLFRNPTNIAKQCYSYDFNRYCPNDTVMKMDRVYYVNKFINGLFVMVGCNKYRVSGIYHLKKNGRY